VRRALAALLGIALAGLSGAGCSPRVAAPGGNGSVEPAICGDTLRMPDGARLPLNRWRPHGGEPEAVILAVHGFGDHGLAFDTPGAWFAAHDIAVYAYDQRGFGGAPDVGMWPGTDALVGDLATTVRLIRARHSETPLYLLGTSMGGAVVLTAAARDALPPVAGTILAAPAVWARSTMPFYQRWALWLGARVVPWLTVSGSELDVRASDNTAELYALGVDPRVIGAPRVDVLHGLTNLMDAALAAGDDTLTPLLALYGAHDEIVPARPMLKLWRKLPAAGVTRALYADGWHMLLRDRHAHRVWRDIAAWIESGGSSALPSGAAEAGARALKRGALSAPDE